MNICLLIAGMRVQHANALTSWNVIAAPAVTAHMGFAGAIAHRYNLTLESAAFLHHGIEHEGRFEYGCLHPNRVRGVPFPAHPQDRKLELSDQPFALAHYETSLLLNLQGRDADALVDECNDGRLETWLSARARFAGGAVTHVRSLEIFESSTQAIGHLPKAGHWILDRRDLIEKRPDSHDQLDAALTHLYPDPASGVHDKKTRGAEKYDEVAAKPTRRHWLGMSTVGYMLLHDPSVRAGVRQNLPHAFCEPLLGLIEYRSRRLPVDDVPLFWRMTHPAPDAVVAQAHS